MILIAVALCALQALLCLALSRRLRFVAYSSVYGLVCFYLFLGLGGSFLYPILIDERGASAVVELSASERMWTMSALLSLAIAASAGALTYIWMSRFRHPPAMTSVTPLTLWPALITCVPAVLFCIGVGPANLLFRSEYLAMSSPAAMTASSALAPCALVALGYLGAAGGRRSLMLSLLFLAVYLLLFFAQATRLLALAPLFYVAGRLLAGKTLRRSWFVVTAAFVALPFLLQLSLFLRGLPDQGLVPFSKALVDGSIANGRLGESSTARNIFFGFELTGYVAAELPLTSHDLWVSITPAPGALTDWATLSESLRVNIYTPFNTSGELLNHGWLPALAYYFVAGLMLAKTDAIVASAKGLQLLTSMPLLGLAWAFVIRSTQYNLRSCTRLLYYLLLAHCIQFVWRYVSATAASRAAHGTPVRSSPSTAPLAMNRR
jgi:hypothetical protein